MAWVNPPIRFIIIIKLYKFYFLKYAHTRTRTIQTYFYRLWPIWRRLHRPRTCFSWRKYLTYFLGGCRQAVTLPTVKSPVLCVDLKATPLPPWKLARKGSCSDGWRSIQGRALSSAWPPAAPRPAPHLCTFKPPRPALRPPPLRLWFAAEQVNSYSRSRMNNEWNLEVKPRAQHGGLSLLLPGPPAPFPLSKH